ncbi:MAG: hypothetical protein H6741_17100 [Alphaproteobacteria bacterium]|nr:hypothetical protein [Alphaproteobacteria bacterium]MCB9794434.1 hypothetical protein [Alphaproteobacteria bacterium]
MRASGEFTVEMHAGGARLSGVMRLASPAAYSVALQPIGDRIEAGGTEPLEIDLSKLSFLNSSGITALSRLVLGARSKKLPLLFLIDESVLWQKKTLPSLARLYPGMELRSI